VTRLIVIVGFVVAFSAGFLIGISPAGNRIEPATEQTSERRGRGPESWLAEQLSLTSDQQKQMKDIWSEVAKRGGRHQREERSRLRKERDEAIAALIREEDRAAYEQIVKEFEEKNRAMDAEARAAFQQAVARTKEILTPEQRQKYEEILSKADLEGRDRRRGTSGPTTANGR
jgi:Spy/CpxP family protein refolding chaperone